MGTKALKSQLGWVKTTDVVWINEHLARARAEAAQAKPASSTAQRLASKLDTSAGLDACHHFRGSLSQHSGYAQLWDLSPRTGRPSMRAGHVVAWELHHQRRVPEGMHVLHRCSHKDCCNWRHLYLGDRRQNMSDARRAKRLGLRKLNPEEAVAICAAFDAGASAPTLAKKYDVTVQTIWKVTRGVTWSRYTNRYLTYVARPTGRPPLPKLAQAA